MSDAVSNDADLMSTGSYGGFLSAANRLLHPDVIHGAIVWAGPLSCLGPDKEDPNIFSWFNYVSNIYRRQSATAAGKIQAALQYLQQETAKGT